MFYSFEICLPNFIHKKTLTVNPNRTCDTLVWMITHKWSCDKWSDKEG